MNIGLASTVAVGPLELYEYLEFHKNIAFWRYCETFFCACLLAFFRRVASVFPAPQLVSYSSSKLAPMTDEDDTSFGASDGDLSSADLSDGERGAKEMEPGSLGPPELGDAPPLLSGYSQMYIVQKQDPQRDQGRNRQVREFIGLLFE